MQVISGLESLSAFRIKNDGRRILSLLAEGKGRLKIDWAVGVGKSSNIDQVIEESVNSGQYDLVIALFPTRQIINERSLVANPKDTIKVVNLKPRPKIQCGGDINCLWEIFEKRNLGMLGRKKLCGHCPEKTNCSWTKQFGKALRGVQVIIGTQAHLERSPYFLGQLVQWTESRKPLVILDEANFIMKPFQRTILRKDLIIFLDIIKKVSVKNSYEFNPFWVYLCELLINAETTDLRSPDWKMPVFSQKWALEVQSLGYNTYGNDFHFLSFDLSAFGFSPIESREKAQNGDIKFAAVPDISMDFIVYSGTAHHEFSRYRLGNDFASPFENFSFIHPETTWFNIASRLGAKRYFIKNSSQILDFFARLIARRLQEGKKPLLIAKKCFLLLCARELEVMLRELGVETRIICNELPSDTSENVYHIPLINYGMIGTNLFQEFECAYCLTGYYVPEEAVNSILQDLLGSDMNIPLHITIQDRPCRRTAGALHKADQVYDIHHLAQHALNHLEMDTVLQAVGRVRPYTKPREVITFQCAQHPKLEYTKEFNNISEARDYFYIPDRRSANKFKRHAQIKKAKAEGKTQSQAASFLGVSLRTIKRYWN